MIQANELRIGNLTEQGEVKSLFENGIHVFFGKCYYFNELKPIPLTEEWLLKFGFVKDENNKSFNIYKHNCFDLFFRVFNENEISFCFTNEYILIKYAHQLQNLYFALTNEELTLKL